MATNAQRINTGYDKVWDAVAKNPPTFADGSSLGNGERLGSRSQSPGAKITATRPLQPTPIDDSGIPKPKPIPSVHSRIPNAYELGNDPKRRWE